MRALNGGPQFAFTEAISLELFFDSQAELDAQWSASSSDGAARAMQAMLGMQKLDIAALQAACDG